MTNLSKVEKGYHQPGIGLAVKLVEATGANVGLFFEELWLDTAPKMPDLKLCCSQGVNFVLTLPPLSGVRCIFGPLFLQARQQTGVTQRIIADFVGYSLRNMGKIEKGQQEPGVMIALGMIGATGVDIRSFFSTLHEVMARK